MRQIGTLLLFAFAATAAPTLFGQAVQGKVAAGFGGYYKIGKCMPVRISLENSGIDLAGEIVVQISKTSVSQAVLLPSPSRKTFVFYLVPPKYFHDLEVKLLVGGKVLKVFTSAVHRVSDEELLVVKSSTLSPGVSSTIGLSGKERVIFIDPQDFPESWNEYDAVSSVFLDTSDTTRLSETQRTALSRWTSLGGIVNLVSRNQISVQSSGAAQSASFRTALGLGTFGWIETPGNSPGMNYQPSLMDLDEEIFKALRIREPIDLSGILWATGVFLLVYAAVIVYVLLAPGRKGSAGLWKFSVIPAIALIFSAAAPSTGLVVNGGKVLVRQYSVFHVLLNSPDVFTANDLSILFPRKVDWKLSPSIASPYLVQNESEASEDAVQYKFEGKELPSAAFRIGAGRTGLLSLAGFSGQGVFYALRAAESTRLANRSQFLLRGCTLIRDGESVAIGDIPAGKQLLLNPQIPAPAESSGSSAKSAMLSKTIDVYQTETLAGTTGDCVVCEMSGLIPSIKSNRAGLSFTGSSAVVYHLGKHQPTESEQQ